MTLFTIVEGATAWIILILMTMRYVASSALELHSVINDVCSSSPRAPLLLRLQKLCPGTVISLGLIRWQILISASWKEGFQDSGLVQNSFLMA